MKVKFSIEYRTRWGQELVVCGDHKFLGNWDSSNALKLKPVTYELWEGELNLEANETIEFKFALVEGDNVEYESGDNRVFKSGKENMLYRTYWRAENLPSANLYTSPFKNVFFKREKPKKSSSKSGNVRFELRAPRLAPDQELAIVGSITELGDWDPDQAVVMSDADFPIWNASIKLKQPQDFEYKYLILDKKSKEIVWEDGDNRIAVFSGTLSVLSDEEFRYPSGGWRGAGVAIPVFSLRSKNGLGVGEFLDLIPFADWAADVSMRLVQILPVNDTIANKDWTDSYPYSAITAFALHPIYGNIEAVGKIKDKALAKEVKTKKTELNALSEVDYEAVVDLKMRCYQALYDQDSSKLFKTKAYKSFFKDNQDWLMPYSAFSALRDTYGTPDFTRWGKYSKFDEKKISKYAKENADLVGLYYFIQYHLDQQLLKAVAHARSKQVVLKGDIPIGIYRNSVDAWVSPDQYHMDSQAGAPPDDFSVTGQNWGFPTYNWPEMAKDGFTWWRERFKVMARYFDVFRIDHILGFFRIWEIPWEFVDGTMGHFSPSLSYCADDLRVQGIPFDFERYCKPYLKHHVVQQIFGSHADMIFEKYLDSNDHGYRFKSEFDTQRKIAEHFNGSDADFDRWLSNNLIRLHTEVLFVENGNEDAFNPRIAAHSTFSYKDLSEDVKHAFNQLYDHFYYHKHNDYWRESAMSKLPSLKDSTEMLVCGEDLGMVPACVPGVMNELDMLSLAIQRMPADDREFWHPKDTPYNSVTTTGSHDMSTLREWWQEDPRRAQRFYNSIMEEQGEAPFYCETEVVYKILTQHLASPSMWAIFPLQDLLALDQDLRRLIPEEERINIPAIVQHYWRYRMHLDIEELADSGDFNKRLAKMIDSSGRNSHV